MSKKTLRTHSGYTVYPHILDMRPEKCGFSAYIVISNYTKNVGSLRILQLVITRKMWGQCIYCN